MDKRLVAELKEAEAAVAEAEKKLGSDHPDLADKLQRYANLLRQTETRKLDAVNVEARARAIRAKVYAEDEKAHGTGNLAKPTKTEAKAAGPAYGMYLGIAGVFLALSSLFVSQSLIKVLLPVAILLGIADVAITRGGFWRVALVVVFSLACWMCNESLPGNMLVTDTPINRFDYAMQNPELVANAKKLASPIQVLSYSIWLPEGFTQTADDKQDWGRVVTWQAAADENQVAPQLSMVLMKLPEDFAQKKGRTDLFSLTRDQAMPRVGDLFGLSDMTQDPPHYEEINGIEYAKVTFTGRSNDVPRSGFAYVAVNNKVIVILCGDDAVTAKTDVLPVMDAGVYTLKKVRAEDDNQFLTAPDADGQSTGDASSQ